MEPNGNAPEETEKIQRPERSSSPSPQQKIKDQKITEILEACEWKDIEKLRALATSDGGLVSDHVRRQAWPLLLGQLVNVGDTDPEGSEKWRDLPKHRDEEQVEKDVNRSFLYYPNDQTTNGLDRRKEELSDLIVEVLRQQPYLSYFQGYHDICQVFLLVLEPQVRASTMARLSALRIRDFMLPTLAPAIAQLRLIPEIIKAVDPKLCHHISQTQPFFAISGTLTMYAHDIQEYGDITRLFDVFLARETVFSVYMFAQIVLQRSDELFETPADESDMLQAILSKLPKPLDLESLISATTELIRKHPPETLRGWRSMSNSSVMKTARWPDQTVSQSLEDGEAFFKKQVKELRWVEAREKIGKIAWKYRKSAGPVGLAIAIGVLSLWLRRPLETRYSLRCGTAYYDLRNLNWIPELKRYLGNLL